jgi:DnaJ-class molecular chaperone
MDSGPRVDDPDLCPGCAGVGFKTTTPDDACDECAGTGRVKRQPTMISLTHAEIMAFKRQSKLRRKQ